MIQDICKKDKGSKSCKDPHTSFTILTRTISNEEMDALVYGGCFGARLKLTVEVIVDPNPLLPQPTTSKEGAN